MSRAKRITDEEAEALFLMGVTVYVRELTFWKSKDDETWECSKCWDCREWDDEYVDEETFFAIVPDDHDIPCKGPHFPKMAGDYYLIGDEEDQADTR